MTKYYNDIVTRGYYLLSFTANYIKTYPELVIENFTT